MCQGQRFEDDRKQRLKRKQKDKEQHLWMHFRVLRTEDAAHFTRRLDYHVYGKAFKAEVGILDWADTRNCKTILQAKKTWPCDRLGPLVARKLGVDPSRVRLWIVIKRDNHSLRVQQLVHTETAGTDKAGAPRTVTCADALSASNTPFTGSNNVINNIPTLWVEVFEEPLSAHPTALKLGGPAHAALTNGVNGGGGVNGAADAMDADAGDGDEGRQPSRKRRKVVADDGAVAGVASGGGDGGDADADAHEDALGFPTDPGAGVPSLFGPVSNNDHCLLWFVFFDPTAPTARNKLTLVGYKIFGADEPLSAVNGPAVQMYHRLCAARGAPRLKQPELMFWELLTPKEINSWANMASGTALGRTEDQGGAELVHGDVLIFMLAQEHISRQPIDEAARAEYEEDLQAWEQRKERRREARQANAQYANPHYQVPRVGPKPRQPRPDADFDQDLCEYRMRDPNEFMRWCLTRMVVTFTPLDGNSDEEAGEGEEEGKLKLQGGGEEEEEKVEEKNKEEKTGDADMGGLLAAAAAAEAAAADRKGLNIAGLGGEDTFESEEDKACIMHSNRYPDLKKGEFRLTFTPRAKYLRIAKRVADALGVTTNGDPRDTPEMRIRLTPLYPTQRGAWNNANGYNSKNEIPQPIPYMDDDNHEDNSLGRMMDYGRWEPWDNVMQYEVLSYPITRLQHYNEVTVQLYDDTDETNGPVPDVPPPATCAPKPDEDMENADANGDANGADGAKAPSAALAPAPATWRGHGTLKPVTLLMKKNTTNHSLCIRVLKKLGMFKQGQHAQGGFVPDDMRMMTMRDGKIASVVKYDKIINPEAVNGYYEPYAGGYAHTGSMVQGMWSPATQGIQCEVQPPTHRTAYLEKWENDGRCSFVKVVHWHNSSRGNWAECFGRPFFAMILREDTLGEFLERVRRRMRVPKAVFRNWKLAAVPDYSPTAYSNAFKPRLLYDAFVEQEAKDAKDAAAKAEAEAKAAAEAAAEAAKKAAEDRPAAAAAADGEVVLDAAPAPAGGAGEGTAMDEDGDTQPLPEAEEKTPPPAASEKGPQEGEGKGGKQAMSLEAAREEHRKKAEAEDATWKRFLEQPVFRHPLLFPQRRKGDPEWMFGFKHYPPRSSRSPAGSWNGGITIRDA